MSGTSTDVLADYPNDLNELTDRKHVLQPDAEPSRSVDPFSSQEKLSVSFFDFQHKQPLLETSFELVHRHLARGDQVTYRFLGFDVPNVSFMSPVTGSVLAGRWLPERKAARLVATDSFSFRPRSRIALKPLPFPLPGTLPELRSIEYRDFDLGMAVASSLITRTGNSRVEPREHRTVVRKMLQGAIAVYDLALEVLEDEEPDLVYLFNGRFAYERAVLRACQANGVPYMIHERGSSPERYYLRPYIPHDRVRLQADVRASWEAVRDHADALDVAHRWFVERREGEPRDWPSFTAKQVPDSLPSVAPNKRIVAYFSSSDDEYEAIGSEYQWEGWKDQFDAVTRLIGVVEDLEDVELVVRVHPNLLTKHRAERTRWMGVAEGAHSVTVIAPESHIDTYALIDAADVVVTSGSTIGIEAVYWRRPSLLLGPSEYDELGAAHRVRSVEELRALLTEPSLPVDPETALAYGYHRATFGEPFTLYKPTAFSGGTFMGVELRPWIWRAAAVARYKAQERFRFLGRPLTGGDAR
jgi:hypothetical protein